MTIIYEHIATDGAAKQSPLSHCTHSYSVYPALFVASYSNIPKWEENIYNG